MQEYQDFSDSWDPFVGEKSAPFEYDKFYGKLGDLDHAKSARWGNNPGQTVKIPSYLEQLIKEIMARFPQYKSMGDFLRDAAVCRAHMLGERENCPPEVRMMIKELEASAKVYAYISEQEKYEMMIESWTRGLNGCRDENTKTHMLADMAELIENVSSEYWRKQLEDVMRRWA